jgi:hypothetical protein
MKRYLLNHFILKSALVLVLCLLVVPQASSQTDYSFLEKKNYEFPWAGGMNSVQIGEVDINRDGIMDVVVFDRQGNRIIPFINGGLSGEIDYNYAPEYIEHFPVLFDWAIFVDYNNDGKSDIFTYSPGWAGMMVYKNVSSNQLKFKRVVYPYLSSLNSGGEVNILVTYADYPGIVDLDNDGDLDILTFWGLGSFVEMHKNLSMETYGHADSLIFEKTEECWGHFAESDESNVLFLDTCIPTGFIQKRKERHTGSTFLLLDLDDDNDKDLLLGDVDYPGLFALTNGGTPEEAHITAVDTLFPRQSKKVRVFSMPAAAYFDVNNDGKKDLIVSPFDPNPFISKNYNSAILYLNNGTNSNPDFQYQYKPLLQNDMIDVGSGAMPVFFDWDNDGLKDLFIGNYGYWEGSWYDEHFTLRSRFTGTVAYFKNTGSINNPEFTSVDMDFGGFFMEEEKFTGIAPTFGDIDGDGDVDMLTGNDEGTLFYFENSGIGMERRVEDYMSVDVGEFSTPQLFDLDKDGLLDLIVGEKDGNLNYYHNEGSAIEPDFVFVTDSLGKVNVTDYSLSWYGYSIPWFYRGQDGNTKLLVGSEQGKLFYFENIDDNLQGAFRETDQLRELIGLDELNVDRGMRTAATLADVNSDGDPELVAGNFSGGVELFGGEAEVVQSVKKNEIVFNKLVIVPNPASEIITINVEENSLKAEISVYDITGRVVLRTRTTFDKGSEQMDVSGLKAGMYVVNIKGDNGFYSGGLFVKN